MYIIANELADDWGTTEYLKALNEELQSRYSPRLVSATQQITVKSKLITLYADYNVFAFPEKNSGGFKNVAVATVGSDADYLECLLRDVNSKNNAELIICGTKTKGRTIDMEYKIMPSAVNIWIRAPHLDKMNNAIGRNILDGGYIQQVKYLISEILNVNI